MPKQLSIKEQLFAAKKVMELTGGLHDIQIYQLKVFPCMIHAVVDAKVKIDTELHNVTYDCQTISKKWANKDHELERLYKWTRDTVWADVSVTVKINKKKVFTMSPESWTEFAKANGIKDE